jgi:NAD(P)-dependent dehydrogenase (short-subunit alcohol dehydrogenase family)/rhamnose utilization protein RhaD (predicted bifunctional aldolase and dehydrogenase)
LRTDGALRHLVRISKAVGKDTSLVQGGGGNTSVKSADGQYMYIKASGTALKDMDERHGWRRLRLDSVLAILDDTSLSKLPPGERESRIMSRLLLSCEDDVAEQARPSVESHLHALLGRSVVHLHPVAVGAFVCSKDGRAELERLFAKDELPPLWVPYADPGYGLALRIRRLIRQYEEEHGRQPGILFLEKHGLLVSASAPDDVLAIVGRIISTCPPRLSQARPARARRPSRDEVVRLTLAIRKAHFEATGRRAAVKLVADAAIMGFLARKDARQLVGVPALTPDEFAYAGGPPLWVTRAGAPAIAGKLKRQMAQDERPPTSFLVPGMGLFVVGTERSTALVKDVVTASLAIRAGASRFGGPNALTPRQRDFLGQWEMERYRKEVAGVAGEGELAGQLAIVTGAGSGLGRSIAIGLARAGAMVALADVDLAAAEEAAAVIANEVPSGCCAPVRCDVTSEPEVARAFDVVLDRWGGLDILVNAAGIAPAYPLVDLPLEQWRATLDVNLTGYFLMARAAARIMIEQGMGGSIVNVSSKSGLEASKSNTPYNATKAGEIHMARGWALELGEHGIRANAIAPGNVFEGSKIWSPEYIEACAKKHGIRPEEVIPHYVGMTALKREITGQDVAEAVVFLCSERARTITGQTIVPDSGQVMVR